MNWFDPVLTLVCKQSMLSMSLVMFAKVFLDGFGGPVSNLKLQLLHVTQETCWLVPVRTSSCEHSSCSGVGLGGGGGKAIALLFALANAAGDAATAATAAVAAALAAAFGGAAFGGAAFAAALPLKVVA